MKELLPETLQWMAGYFDAEGCILWQRTPKITINNTNYNTLKLFANYFGGTVKIKSRKDTEFYSKLSNKLYKINKDQYYWILCGKNAIIFLEHIKMYLIIKREQADFVLHCYTDNILLSNTTKSQYLTTLKQNIDVEILSTSNISDSYLAGLIDGDGSICCVKRSNRSTTQVRVNITSKHYNFIKYLISLLNGYYSTYNYKGFTSYKITWVGRSCISILVSVALFGKEKHLQALQGLLAINDTHNMKYVNTVKELNYTKEKLDAIHVEYNN